MPSSVQIFLYDLSGGLARSMSQMLIGVYMDAVYHSSVVVYGREYYFGGDGICGMHPCTTHFGTPMERIEVGSTDFSEYEVQRILGDLMSDWQGFQYDFFNHNCNNFSHTFIQRLTRGAAGAPAHVVGQAQHFAGTPFGQMMVPYIRQALDQAAKSDNSLAQSLAPSRSAQTSSPTGAAVPSAPVLYEDLEPQELGGKSYFVFNNGSIEGSIGKLVSFASESLVRRALDGDASYAEVEGLLSQLAAVPATDLTANIALVNVLRFLALNSTYMPLLIHPPASLTIAELTTRAEKFAGNGFSVMLMRYVSNLAATIVDTHPFIWSDHFKLLRIAWKLVRTGESMPIQAALGAAVNIANCKPDDASFNDQVAGQLEHMVVAGEKHFPLMSIILRSILP